MKYVIVSGLAAVGLLAIICHLSFAAKSPGESDSKSGTGRAIDFGRTGQADFTRRRAATYVDPMLVLEGSARKAISAGDYSKAERICKRILTERPETAFVRRDLATVYDRTGRDHDAWTSWKAVVYGAGRSVSSDQNDPIVLARYGDLCRKFGHMTEADAIYRKAVRGRHSYIGMQYGVAVTMNTPSNELRADAEFEAGVELLTTGHRQEALSQLCRAVNVGPNLPVPRLGYAIVLFQTGRLNDCRYQMWKAQRLADGELAAQIEKTRSDFGMLYQDVHVYADNHGHERVVRTPYNPATSPPLIEPHRPNSKLEK